MEPKKGRSGYWASCCRWATRTCPAWPVAADTGECGYGLFKNGAIGSERPSASPEHLAAGEMASALSKALGEEVRYNTVSFEAYLAFGFPGAEDLGNMFQFKHDFNNLFCGGGNLTVSRAFNPSLQTFERWRQDDKSRILLE